MKTKNEIDLSTYDKTKPWVYVEFTHSDGLSHIFYSAINEMTGDRLSAFDDSPPTVGDSLSWVKSVVRDIKARAENVKIKGKGIPK